MFLKLMYQLYLCSKMFYEYLTVPETSQKTVLMPVRLLLLCNPDIGTHD